MRIESKEDYEKFINYLIKNAPKIDEEELNKKQSICCSNYKFLGYYIPECRKLSKEILRDGYEGILEYGKNIYYEEVLIRGLVLAGIKDKNIVERNIDKYIKSIDSWSICDSVITSFSCYKKEIENRDFEKFCNYAKSQEEFISRFGLMMIFRYCLNQEYIDKIFELIKGITNHKYYIDMAISWLLCECMIKFPEKTLPLIKEKVFVKFIQNKAISKCRDSFRIDDEVKEVLKLYRL